MTRGDMGKLIKWIDKNYPNATEKERLKIIRIAEGLMDKEREATVEFSFGIE